MTCLAMELQGQFDHPLLQAGPAPSHAQTRRRQLKILIIRVVNNGDEKPKLTRQ